MWHGRKENLEQGQSSPSTFFSGAEGITIFPALGLALSSPGSPRADVAARRLAGSAASSSPPPRRTRLCFAVFSRRRFAFLRFSIVTCTSPPPLTAAAQPSSSSTSPLPRGTLAPRLFSIPTVSLPTCLPSCSASCVSGGGDGCGFLWLPSLRVVQRILGVVAARSVACSGPPGISSVHMSSFF